MTAPRCARLLASALSVLLFLSPSPSLAAAIQTTAAASGAPAGPVVLPVEVSAASEGAGSLLLPLAGASLAEGAPLPGLAGNSPALPGAVAAVLPATALPAVSAPLAGSPAAAIHAPNSASVSASAAEPLGVADAAPARIGRVSGQGAAQALPEAEAEQGRRMESRLWEQELTPRGFVRAGSGDLVPLEASQAAGSGLEASPADPGTAHNGAASAVVPEAQARRTTRGFLASLVAAQLWVEGSMLIAPLLAKDISDSFMFVSAMGILSFLGLTAGSLLGGRAVDRRGIRAVYLGTMAGRAAVGVALAYLYFTGGLGMLGLLGLVGLEFLLLGASRIAEAKLPTALHGSAEIPVNRFGIQKQKVIEGIGIVGPLAAGWLIALAGFGPALAVLPAIMVVGLVLAAAMLRVSEAPVAAGDAAAKPGLRQLGAAWRALRSSPQLRRATVGLILTYMLTAFLYFLIAPAFGLFVTGSIQSATSVAALLTGLFALGGFAATWISDWFDAAAKRRLAKVPDALRPAAERRAFLGGARGWSLAAAVGFLGLWSLLWAAPVAGLLPAYLFMIPLGIVATGVLIPFETIIRTQAPEEARGTVIGMSLAVVQTAIALGFLGLGWLFDFFSEPHDGVAVPTSRVFLGVALLGTLASAGFLYLAAQLHRQIGTEAAVAAPDRPDEVKRRAARERRRAVYADSDPEHEERARQLAAISATLERAAARGKLTLVLNPSFQFDDGTTFTPDLVDIPNALDAMSAYPAIKEVNIIVLAASLDHKREVLEHFLTSLPPEKAARIRAAVRFVALDNPQPLGHLFPADLSRLFLDERNTQALARLKEQIAKLGGPEIALQYGYQMVDPYAWGLANSLGIAVFGPHNSHYFLGQKSGGGEFLTGLINSGKVERLSMADGELDIYSEDQLVDALYAIAKRQTRTPWSRLGAWLIGQPADLMVKVEDEAGGEGNARFRLRLPARLRGEAAIKKAIREALPGMKFYGKGWEGFRAWMEEHGGVAEVFIPGAAGAPSPSSWGVVDPDGSVRVLSVQDQLLQDGNIYVGAQFPSNDSYRGEIVRITRTFLEEMSKLGVRGPSGFDFMVVPDGRLKRIFKTIRSWITRKPYFGYEIFVIEINFREIGGTFPFLTVREVTGAREEDGLLLQRDGSQVYYIANYRHRRPTFKAPGTLDRFLRFFSKEGSGGRVLFDPRTGEGAVFPLMRELELGKASYYAAARSPARLKEIEADLMRALSEFEAAPAGDFAARAAALGLGVRGARNADRYAINDFINEIRRTYGQSPEADTTQPGGWDEDLADIERAYAPGAGEFLLLERSGRLLGTGAIVKTGPKTAELRKFYFSPELRGKGLGKSMLAELVARARAMGMERMELVVYPSKKEAIGLYQSFGFKPFVPAEDRGEDPGALFFYLDLTRTPEPAAVGA